MLWRKAAKKLHAKGYSTTKIADMLEDEFGTGLGLGRSSLGVLVTTEKEEVPPDKLPFLESLPVLNEKRYKNYLSETANEPADEESAAPVTPKLDALVSMVGTKLDALLSALKGELGTVATSLLGKLDAFTMKGDAKLDTANGKLDTANRELGTVQATLNHTDAMVGVLAAKMDTSEVQRRKDKRHMLASVCGTGLAVVASVFGTHCQHAPTAAPPAQVTVNVGPGQRGTEGTAKSQPDSWIRVPYLGSTEATMGERKPSQQQGPRMLPHGSMPGQAVKPCPSVATSLYGACWIEVANQRAPCPRESFQEGERCYVPVQADPNVPVGETMQPPNTEQR